MNEIDKRSRYVTTVMQHFKDPLHHLFNLMPKRWQTYAIDLYRYTGASWEGVIRSTYIYGCRNHIWIRMGDGINKSITVKVSNRGHIYLD